MQRLLDPFRFVLISLAGWPIQQHPFAIENLREENGLLRERLVGRGIRLNDDQRRRLAAKARQLGQRIIGSLSNLGHHIARVAKGTGSSCQIARISKIEESSSGRSGSEDC